MEFRHLLVIHLRNKLLHSSSLSLHKDETEEALLIMIQFLQKFKAKVSEEDDNTQMKKTVEKLNELKNASLMIFLKANGKCEGCEEQKVIKEIIKCHQDHLTSLKDISEMIKEIKAMMPPLQLITDNPDLKSRAEEGFHNLISLSLLEERVEATATRLGSVTGDLASLHEQVLRLTHMDNSTSEGKSTDKADENSRSMLDETLKQFGFS